MPVSPARTRQSIGGEAYRILPISDFNSRSDSRLSKVLDKWKWFG